MDDDRKLRAAEIREHVAWFDRQEMSLSSVEEFRGRMLSVADGLEAADDTERRGRLIPLPGGFSRRVG